MRAWMSRMRPIARTSPVGLARELVGAVTGADRNGQGIDTGIAHEARRLVGIGQHLLVAQLALRTDAVFFPGKACFQRAQATDLALHRHTAGMRHLDHLPRHAHVVIVIGGGFAVLAERTIHHHRAETELDGALAHCRRHAVILVHHDRNVRKLLDRREHEVPEKIGTGIFARARRGLHDHRTGGLVRGLHDRAHLLEVVDIESRHPVPELGGVVEQLSHADQ